MPTDIRSWMKANADGEIIQTRFLDANNEGGGLPQSEAPDVVYRFYFDASTNQGLISAYNQNSAEFRMDGGTPTQNGVPVTENPPSSVYQAIVEDLPGVLAKLENNDPFSTGEIKAALIALFHDTGRL